MHTFVYLSVLLGHMRVVVELLHKMVKLSVCLIN
jgi:hypothetical protein